MPDRVTLCSVLAGSGMIAMLPLPRRNEELTMRSTIVAVLILACAFPASAAGRADGVIRITATYPGAEARTVDETVIGALFSQLSGIEGTARIESEARNDGTGTVTIYFWPETDLNLAQMQVQDRVNLTLPAIPAPCRELGIQVRKLPAGPPAFLVALTSSDSDVDAMILGNYAMVFFKPQFARVRGVADVRIAGVGEYAVRVRLMPDRLRAYRLMAGDVVDALRRQNAGVAGGTIGGGERRHTVTASGRLTKVEEFSAVVLRTNPDGEVLRVRDVAEVDLGSTFGGFARVNAKPAALIAVTAWPGRVDAGEFYKVPAVEDLRPGMRLDVVADRAVDRFLEVEMRQPDSASLERTEKVVKRTTELIRGLPGKPDVVALAEDRTPNAATILVKLPAKAGPTVADVRKALAAIPDAAIRVGVSQPGEEAFPVRFALTAASWDEKEEPLREAADRVVAQLLKEPGVAYPAAFPGPSVPHYDVNIDRSKCAKLGVELESVLTTLRVTLGGVNATDFSKYGRRFRVAVQVDPQFTRQIEDLTQLFVRSSTGEMVPLEKLIKIRKAVAPSAVVRVNGRRAVIVTAAPADGKTPAEAAALCVKLAQKVLPKGFHVKDLTGPPR
ncbi:MAG TPA: efflux RND transporter permease subunit [Gemmataceae bacterium]|nr:efflux RND transporter permease subunit [Gemmataceae bacterium]